MGAANNGNQNNSNNSDHNSKKRSTKKKTQKQNNKNKSKGKGFNGAAKDGALSGIVLATDRPVPLLGLINKFLESLQAYANNKGMTHVADCIDNTEDLNMDDFQPEEIDMSDCIQMVTTRKLGADGKLIKDLQGNELRDKVKVITNANRYNAKNELQKHKMRTKEEEYRKFKGNKKICLGSTKLQMCPGVHDTLDTVPKYAAVKNKRDLIGTLKIL